MWLLSEFFHEIPGGVIQAVTLVLIFLIGAQFIKRRMLRIINIRYQIMEYSVDIYLKLPPAKEMFWQLNKWTASSFIKDLK